MKQAFFRPDRVTAERIDAYWERLTAPGLPGGPDLDSGSHSLSGMTGL